MLVKVCKQCRMAFGENTSPPWGDYCPQCFMCYRPDIAYHQQVGEKRVEEEKFSVAITQFCECQGWSECPKCGGFGVKYYEGEEAEETEEETEQ